MERVMRHSGIAVLLAIVIALSCYSFISLVNLVGKKPTQHQQTRQFRSHLASNTTVPFWEYSAFQDQSKAAGNVSKLGFRVYQDKIDSIRLLGERHSGTTFLTHYLQSCFPNISVDDYFVNGKHWFQPSPEYVVNTANLFGESGLGATAANDYFYDRTWWQIAQSDDPSSYFQSTLVVALFRNPYDWIEGMRRIPHHWPNHADFTPKEKSTLANVEYKENKRKRRQRQLRARKLKGSILQKSFVKARILDWEEFVKRPMYLSDYDEKNKGTLCQKGLPFEMVSPCDPDHSYVPPSIRHIPSSFLRNLPFEADDAIYEFNISGRPFKNPMELRAAKITNLLNLDTSWRLGAFGAIQYNEILGHHLDEIIQKIELIIRVPNACPSKKSEFRKSPYNHSSSFLSWVKAHSDWQVEALVGFSIV